VITFQRDKLAIVNRKSTMLSSFNWRTPPAATPPNGRSGVLAALVGLEVCEMILATIMPGFLRLFLQVSTQTDVRYRASDAKRLKTGKDEG
jgi:hypothetical protein